MDEKKNSAQSGRMDNPKDAGNQKGPRPNATKKVLAKRWMYPAIYLGAAALIIGLMYIRSQENTSPTSAQPDEDGVSTSQSMPAVTTPVNTAEFTWPVGSGHDVTMGFFPDKGTAVQQAAALVQYGDTYFPHQGLDIKSLAGTSFSALAAASGKVTSVTSNPLNGTIVEVQSAGGYTERYESLAKADVKAGDSITQGESIGTTGTSQFEASQGNHLFFQVLKNGVSVDPSTLLPAEGQ